MEKLPSIKFVAVSLQQFLCLILLLFPTRPQATPFKIIWVRMNKAITIDIKS